MNSNGFKAFESSRLRSTSAWLRLAESFARGGRG